MQRTLNDLLFEDEQNIWEFIYQKLVVDKKYATISEELWNDYITSNERVWTAKEMSDYYEHNMIKFLRHSFIADHKILALFKVLKYHFTEDMMAFFEKRSAVKMRVRNGCLIDFRMSDSSDYDSSAEPICEKSSEYFVEKSVDQPSTSINQVPVEPIIEDAIEPVIEDIEDTVEITPKKQAKTVPITFSNSEVTPEREEKMWEYVEKNLGIVDNKEFILNSFWIDFAKTQKIPPKDRIPAGHHFTKYFQTEILPDVWKKNIDLRLKMELLIDTNLEITETVRKSLLTIFNVHVDLKKNRVIEGWRLPQGEEEEEEENDRVGNEDNEHLEKYNLKGRIPFTAVDHMEMANFLYDQIFDKKLKEPRVIQPKGIAIWKKFTQVKTKRRSAENLSSHYRKGFQSILYTVRIPPTKVLKLYKHLKIAVNHPVQEIMAKNFKAKIEFVENRVVSWEFIIVRKENLSRKRSQSHLSVPPETDASIKQPRKITKMMGSLKKLDGTRKNVGIKSRKRREYAQDSDVLEPFNRFSEEVENTQYREEVDQDNQHHAQERHEQLEERSEFQNLPEIKKEQSDELVEQPQPQPQIEADERRPDVGYEHLMETTIRILEEGLTVPPTLRKQFLKDVRKTFEKVQREATSEQDFLAKLEATKGSFQRQVRFFA